MSGDLIGLVRKAVSAGRLNAVASKSYGELLAIHREAAPDTSGKLRQIHVVTAANEKFSVAAGTLIASLSSVETIGHIILFDLGLSSQTVDMLEAMDPRVRVDRSLLPLADPDYILRYQFKIDGLMFAPDLLPLDDLATSAILWIDSGILVNGDLRHTKNILETQGAFLCDLTTRKAAGEPGTTIKAFNHLSPWGDAPETYPFDSDVLCQPLSWAGIHGFRYGSDYQRNVIEKAFAMSLEYPALLSGPKFPSPESRAELESSSIFINARERADELGLVLATKRWNGARYDLFLFTCLYHQSGRSLISSLGLIEDITDGQESMRTFTTNGAVIPRATFRPEALEDRNTEFVIHRGSLRLG